MPGSGFVKSWYVLFDDPALFRPRVVRRGLSEHEARALARELNAHQGNVASQGVYFAELFETSSVVDVEHSQS